MDARRADGRSAGGDTPLLAAALLEAGANVRYRNAKGTTAREIAEQTGQTEIVARLDGAPGNKLFGVF